ncbi:MAG: hypothetical protein J6W11_04545 [Alphaproteobacteria bacterium]|nr:hypothetical protein [Alphaproteobacteria bacterium]
MQKTQKQNFIRYGILMLVGMLVSMVLKNENLYDLANYHYYNAFALLHDRSGLDLVPACVNTFFNPIIEVPLYFYIQWFNDKPNILYALQGIWGGLFLCVVYKICGLMFGSDKKGRIYTLLALLLALLGQSVWRQIGASTNEVSVACFILFGLYLLLKTVKFEDKQVWWQFLIAGTVMGLGLGLKQNSISSCVSAGLTMMICFAYFKKPIKSIFFFALGGLAGYLIVNGYFMYKYWVLYSNPFFPFMNAVFHSPYFFDFNYRDARFVPSLKVYFIYPLIWNMKVLVMERPYYDHALSLLYVLFICIFIRLCFKRQLKNFYLRERLFVMLSVFGFLSFMIWMALFSILRYMAAIDAVAAIFLIKLFDLYGAKKHKVVFVLHIMVIIGLFVGVFFYPPREKITGQHIKWPTLSLPENTLVKIYGMASSFIIPEISRGKKIKTVTHYKKCNNIDDDTLDAAKIAKQSPWMANMSPWFKIALKSFLYSPANCFFDKGSDFMEFGPFAAKREKIEKEHVGPVVYIYDTYLYKAAYKVKKNYEKRKNDCIFMNKTGKMDNLGGCLESAKLRYERGMQGAIDEIPDNYKCRKITTNVWVAFEICVPPELEKQIFGENFENRENE